MIKITCVRLDGIGYADVEQFKTLLPESRRDKIDRLRFEPDKLLSLAAGLLICDAIGEKPLKTNAHGKPYAVGSNRCFSVSHSGNCAVIAVDDSEIGVDVEKLPDKDYLKIAERFYHPNELACVTAADDPRRTFTRIWTRKEAYLKQTGTGISTDLKAFDTTTGALSARICSIDLDGYVLSVCAAEAIKDAVDISYKELKELCQ